MCLTMTSAFNMQEGLDLEQDQDHITNLGTLNGLRYSLLPLKPCPGAKCRCVLHLQTKEGGIWWPLPNSQDAS